MQQHRELFLSTLRLEWGGKPAQVTATNVKRQKNKRSPNCRCRYGFKARSAGVKSADLTLKNNDDERLISID